MNEFFFFFKSNNLAQSTAQAAVFVFSHINYKINQLIKYIED